MSAQHVSQLLQDSLLKLLGRLTGDAELQSHGKRAATRRKLAAEEIRLILSPGAAGEAHLAYVRAAMK